MFSPKTLPRSIQYGNTPPKTENFQIKNFDIFHISAQNIDYGTIYVLSRNKKNNVYSCKPQFYYIKVGFKGVNIIQACFHNVYLLFVRLQVLCICHSQMEMH